MENVNTGTKKTEISVPVATIIRLFTIKISNKKVKQLNSVNHRYINTTFDGMFFTLIFDIKYKMYIVGEKKIAW